MLTFAEAMLITHSEVLPEWEVGTLYIMPTGWEDARTYCVAYGAREWLVDDDPLFLSGDIPLALVDKETGEYVEIAVMDMFKWIDKMTKVKLTRAEIEQFNKDVAAV